MTMRAPDSDLPIELIEVSFLAREHALVQHICLKLGPGRPTVLIGPNGSGKSTLSHVLMGREGYEATSGSVTVDGTEILGLEPSQRAAAGLFLAMQYPIEVPGVRIADLSHGGCKLKSLDCMPVVLPSSQRIENPVFDCAFVRIVLQQLPDETCARTFAQRVHRVAVHGFIKQHIAES